MKRLYSAFLVSLLAACGGGGGGGGEQNIVSPTLNLQSAWNTFKQQNGSDQYSISGTVGGITVGGSGEFIIGYQANDSLTVIDTASPFPGPSISWTNLSRTLLEFISDVTSTNGTQRIYATENWYYDVNGRLKVIWNVDDLEQTIITSTADLPTQVTAGDSGSFFTGTIYSRLGYTCGSRVASYSVTARTATTLTVTITDRSNTTEQHIGQCSTGISESKYVFELNQNNLSLKSAVGTDSTVTGSITYTF